MRRNGSGNGERGEGLDRDRGGEREGRGREVRGRGRGRVGEWEWGEWESGKWRVEFRMTNAVACILKGRSRGKEGVPLILARMGTEVFRTRISRLSSLLPPLHHR